MKSPAGKFNNKPQHKPDPADVQRENRPFYTTDTARVFEGFCLCRTNAKKLFSASETIAADNPGLANSLMILCSEECVKCFVLFAVCVDIPVPFLIKQIFSSHDAKHVTGKELHGMARTMSHALGMFSGKGSVKIKSAFSLAMDLGAALTGRPSGASAEALWWDDANRMKNTGIYVDWRGGKFHSPEAVGKETFDESRKIVARFMGLIDRTESFTAADFRMIKDV